MTEMKSPNVHYRKNQMTRPKTKDTSSKSSAAEEKLRIAYACKELLLATELVAASGVKRQAHRCGGAGRRGCTLALAALSARCSKVGSNLNQLARHFNSGGKDTEAARAQILEELSNDELSAESRRNGW